MRMEFKGYKRSKTDLRFQCGEVRLRADTPDEAVLLAAMANLFHYEKEEPDSRGFWQALTRKKKELVSLMIKQALKLVKEARKT